MILVPDPQPDPAAAIRDLSDGEYARALGAGEIPFHRRGCFGFATGCMCEECAARLDHMRALRALKHGTYDREGALKPLPAPKPHPQPWDVAA